MSIILDALRRGRGRPTEEPHSNAARTDAVLATLGYGRFNPTSPFNRLKRLVGGLVIVILLAIVIWAAVIWKAQVDGPSAPTPAQTTAFQPAPVPPLHSGSRGIP